MINLCHVDATKESSEIKMTYVKLRNCLFFSVYVCVQKKKSNTTCHPISAKNPNWYN